MARPEFTQYWNESVRRHQQEQQTVEQGTEQSSLISPEDRRIRRNYDRDQKRVQEEKATAKIIEGNWKGIDAEKQKLLAEQRIKQARQQQELRKRYPDLFPTPKRPA